jgi:alkaline phosphatase
MSLPAHGRVLSKNMNSSPLQPADDGEFGDVELSPMTQPAAETSAAESERQNEPTNFDAADDSDLRYWSWHKQDGIHAAILRNKLLSGTVFVASLLLIITIGISLQSSAGSDSSPKPLPYPYGRMCSGGNNGTLRRLSREAFEYWASVNAKASDNLVIMLADGYGPHYHTMARSVRRAADKNASYQLPLDSFLIGGSITSASSNIITDSAAGATAYSVGHKTFNGALGVAPHARPGDKSPETLDRVCGDSIGGTSTTPACPQAQTGEACCPVRRLANTLEGCRARGMATGIVVTTILPHATPAAWSAHASSRRMYDFIAQQQIEADPPLDVLLGGGRRYFDSRRADGRNLLHEHAHRYTIVTSAQELREAERRRVQGGDTRPLHRPSPLLGLFSDEDLYYELDRRYKQAGAGHGEGGGGRDDEQPSLVEMVEVAVKRLSAIGTGFCLIVEGSRIDHGGHDNDAAASAWDALAYNDAFARVLALTGAGKEDAGGDGGTGQETQTQVVSVADHSTGGLTLGLQTDWEMKHGQSSTCFNGDKCQAQIGAYPYGTRDGWVPSVLAAARGSHAYTSAQLCCNAAFRGTSPQQRARRAAFIKEKLGLDPAPADLDAVDAALARLAPDFQCPADPTLFLQSGLSRGDSCVLATRRQLSLVVQRAAKVGFSSLGHTAVDVEVFAVGSKRMLFAGIHENHEVGQRIFRAAGLDDAILAPITQALNDCQVPVLPDI